MNIKWRLAYQNEVVIISSGLVYTHTTKPKGLTIIDIKKMIRKQPSSSYYRQGVTRRVTLGDKIARDNPEFIGKEIEFYSSISLINPEHDRIFDELPNTGKELIERVYSSKPIKLSKEE